MIQILQCRYCWKNGNGVLLEVKLKDIRYKRCTINGVEHGGLGATGYSS